MIDPDHENEAVAVLPQPAARRVPQAQPGSGVIAKQEVVVGGGKPFDANKVTVAFTQQRIAKAQLPSIEELQEQMQHVAADIQEVQDWYRNVSLDEFWRPVNECKARIAELEAQLAAERAKLEELNPDRHPKQIFVEDVQKVEQATSEFARLLIAKFSDLAAQKQFGVSYDKLTAAKKQDIRLRFEEIYRRIGLPGWVRLHRNERPSDEQVDETVSRILEALNYLLGESSK
jgi:uncharacterized coiled-coil protein SlyX